MLFNLFQQSYSAAEVRCLVVNEPQKVILLLRECLGFHQVALPELLRSTDLLALANDGGSRFLLYTGKIRRHFDQAGEQKIIVHTRDCLKDYYELKKRSIPASDPFYLERGLAVDLADHWGNRYMLLETRNYLEY